MNLPEAFFAAACGTLERARTLHHEGKHLKKWGGGPMRFPHIKKTYLKKPIWKKIKGMDKQFTQLYC